MSAISGSVLFSGMTRKEKTSATEQVNVRLKVETIEAIESYKDRQLLRPTTTQIMQAAVDEWLARHGTPPKRPKA